MSEKLSAISFQLSDNSLQGIARGLVPLTLILSPRRGRGNDQEGQAPALRSSTARPASLGPRRFYAGRSLGDILRRGRALLAEHGLAEANLEAEVLLMHVLGISRAFLYAHYEEPVSTEDLQAYECLMARRLEHEPLAYITGVREFYGLELSVDRRVLIPRPETETLVEEGLKLVRRQGPGPPLLADIGTGSGAIAIALACHLHQAKVYATDISQDALEVAAANCRRHGVADRVVLLPGNLLEPLPEAVDMVVGNLPYVPASVLPALAPEVSCHEPRVALDGGPRGLGLVRGLLAQAPSRLRPGGRVLLEIGADQAAEVVREAGEAVPGARTRVVQDLAGLDRLLVVELAA